MGFIERQTAIGVIQDLHQAAHSLVQDKHTRDMWIEYLENYKGNSQEELDYWKKRVTECEKHVEKSKEAAKGAFDEFREYFGPDLGI